MTLRPDGTTCPLNETLLAKIVDIQESWAALGHRVLLLARKILKPSAGDVPSKVSFDDALFGTTLVETAQTGLTFVGLVGIVVYSG
jgi:magnesium-transporting ATPase (P-type)